MRKGKFYKGKRINDDGDFLDRRGRVIPDPNDSSNFEIRTADYMDQAVSSQSIGTAEESPENKRYSKEKGFSEITRDWGKSIVMML